MQRFLLIDVETAGLEPDPGLLLQVSCVDTIINDKKVLSKMPLWSFVKHDKPIPPDVKAVNHITERDVTGEGARTAADALAYVTRGYSSTDVFVAHNAAYDIQYLPELADLRQICTFRLANHLMPDAVSYKLWSLLYEIDKGEELREYGYTPHTAQGDAMALDRLFSYFLQKLDYDWHKAIELTQKPILQRKIRFGKHAGQTFAELPLDYLHWLRKSEVSAKDPDLLYTVNHELERRKSK